MDFEDKIEDTHTKYGMIFDRRFNTFTAPKDGDYGFSRYMKKGDRIQINQPLCELKQQNLDYQSSVMALLSVIDDLEKDLELAKEDLEFYADIRNQRLDLDEFDSQGALQDLFEAVEEKARKTLKEIGE